MDKENIELVSMQRGVEILGKLLFDKLKQTEKGDKFALLFECDCKELVMEALKKVRTETKTKNQKNTDKKICDCYSIERKCYFLKTISGQSVRNDYTIGVCNGTREREQCKCGGDTKKCDFYEEVRNG